MSEWLACLGQVEGFQMARIVGLQVNASCGLYLQCSQEEREWTRREQEYHDEIAFMRDKSCIYECVRFYHHFEEFGIYIARDKGGSEWGNGFYG